MNQSIPTLPLTNQQQSIDGGQSPCRGYTAFSFWRPKKLLVLAVLMVVGLITLPSSHATGTVTAWGNNTSGQTNVPAGLSNVVAVAGGGYRSLALRADGTVVAWGDNSYDQTNILAGLSNLVAVAAGSAHSLALRADATVVAWGNNSLGQTNVPAGLSNVVAVAAGDSHSLALRADGTVVAWGYNNYGQTNVPAGLGNVVTVTGGAFHNLALLAEGTVAAWGDNSTGQTNVPVGLSNVVAIAAGGWHSLALRADGTVVAWGGNYYGQTTVPTGLSHVVAVAAGWDSSLALRDDGSLAAWGTYYDGTTHVACTAPVGLTNVVAIAAGYYHYLALARQAPTIFRQPVSRTNNSGTTATFTVTATGTYPLTYQWQIHGTNLFDDGTISGVTTPTLAFANVQTNHAGPYRVVVTNAYGSVTSSVATLTVLAQNCSFAGLSSWWRGESNALDSIAAHNGALQGTVAYASGMVGSAFSFNGASFLSVPDDDSWAFGTNDFTIELWASFAGNGNRVFIGHDQGPGTTPKWFFGLYGNLCFHVNSPATGSSFPLSYPFTPVPGQWYHMAVVRQGNIFQLFVNGTNVQAATSSVSIPNASAPLTIGQSGEGFYMNGRLDEISIYNRALNPSEISSIFTLGSQGKCVEPSPPLIWAQPESLTNATDTTASFSVAATGSPPLRYQWMRDGTNLVNDSRISGATNAALTVSPVQINDAASYSVVVSNSYGSVTSQLAVLTVYSLPSLAEALDATNLIWTTGGSANWRPQTSVTHDGMGAAQSGAISNSQETWVETSVVGPGSLSFWWKVSSESGYDYLEFYLDGVFQSRISGAADWRQETNSIASGAHTLRWRYVKDGSVSSGQDAGWVDQVSFMPDAPTPPAIIIPPAQQILVVGGTATFSVTARGSEPLSYFWQRNGAFVAGATNAACTLTNVQLSDSGSQFSCLVSNAHGTVLSSYAVLLVLASSVCYVALDNPDPVPPYSSWATAANNIQDAVDAVVPGGLVLVSNGVYQIGARAVYGMSNRVAITKPVTVRSVNGPAVTSIVGYRVPGSTNGPMAVRCVYLTNSALLAGFTLTSGATQSSGDTSKNQSGGGVWCESSSAIVSNCVLTGNWAVNCGGGAYAGTLNNCTLTENSVVGVRGEGGGAYQCTLNNCILTGNSAEGVQGSGGGAHSSTLNNCTLTKNSAYYYYGGGAYYCGLNNCTLTGNSASTGGGAYNCGLNNCTLTGNSAGTGGGTYDCTLNNCIVYYNTALSGANYYDYYSRLNYCCTTPLPTGGTSNTDAEPQLASASHLSASSPCIGRGSSAYASGLDLDGEPWANPPAIGCDEYWSGAVTGALSAAIKLSYTNVAVGFVVDFEALIGGRVSASRWDFGDGVVVSNRPWTSHAWAAPGDYAVELRAYNESYPAGIVASVTVRVVRDLHYVALTGVSPVPPYSSWATAATSIQDAVDAAVPGGLVLVTNGVYQSGARVVYGMSNRVAVTKPVTVRSVNGPAVTSVVGSKWPDPATRCVYLTNGALLAGFTLTNGAAQSSDETSNYQSGGGVLCESSSAVVSNCVLTGNWAFNSGGGACGGTLYNCTLTGNDSNGQEYYTLRKHGSGGGAYGCMLNNCTLSDNSAWLNGGGASGCTLNSCTLAGNSASDLLGGDGGGAYHCTLNNCTLTYNYAYGPYSGNGGGGAYGCTLNNCTLAFNWAASSGGGALYGTLNNCIVYYNTASTGGNCSAGYLNYCCTTPLAAGTGNFTNAPLFVDTNGWTNLRLQDSSPCINAGSNAYAPGLTDLGGNPRIADGTVDVGAFEYQPAPSILAQPSDQTVWVGATANFTVAVSGKAPLSYFWMCNGTFIPGATNSSYTIPNVQTNHAGLYSVVVSNLFGVAISSNAVLTVVVLDPSDEASIRALFAALKSRAEAHDLDGFMALFSTNYVHRGNDYATLRQNLQNGLSTVQSFNYSIDRIEGGGTNAIVHCSGTIVFNNGQPPSSWVEPDTGDQGLGLGWVRKNTAGWQVVGSQERASVKVATEHHFGPSEELYLMRLRANSALAMTSVTVSGTNLSGTPLQPDSGWGGFTGWLLGFAPIGTEYSFDVQFTDGTHQILHDTVKSWVPVAPTVSVTTAAGIPTIHWTDVSSAVSNAAYYWVWVDGNGVSWRSQELPLSRTSIPFNEDGGATGSLQSGSNYSVVVFIFNSGGDYASVDSGFTYGSLQFGSLSVSNRTFQMGLEGISGTRVVVDTSFDLKTWTALQTNTLPTGGLNLMLPMGTNRQLFFRARITQP